MRCWSKERRLWVGRRARFDSSSHSHGRAGGWSWINTLLELAGGPGVTTWLHHDQLHSRPQLTSRVSVPSPLQDRINDGVKQWVKSLSLRCLLSAAPSPSHPSGSGLSCGMWDFWLWPSCSVVSSQILVFLTRVELSSFALERWILNHWTARNFSMWQSLSGLFCPWARPYLLF